MESQSQNPEFRKKLITCANRCETGAAVSQLVNDLSGIIKGNEGQIFLYIEFHQ